MVRVIRCRVSGGITPARSVTKPCGCGIGGSAASAAVASASASRPLASPGLGMERVERLHDPLDLAEVVTKLDAERVRNEPRSPLAVVEQARHQRQRTEDLLPLGEHVAVALPRVVALQSQQVTEEDQDAPQGLQHEALERARSAGRRKIQGAQPQQPCARLLLALPAHSLALDRDVSQEVRPAEQAVLATDVLELHRKGVARAAEEVALDQQRRREA